jgi:DNA invertase Pin-like site-specific DNA recombinase
MSEKRMSLKIGYARVSTVEQNLDLQVDALKKAGCETIYSEKISASKTRLELQHALKSIRDGDVLVVWRLDRLARSMRELIEIVSLLDARGVGFESLTEKIDTTSAGGRLMFHIFGALAEFERNLIQERTKAGLDAARARGRKGGRKQVLSEKHKKEIKTLAADPQHRIIDIATRYKVSRSTIYKALND